MHTPQREVLLSAKDTFKNKVTAEKTRNFEVNMLVWVNWIK
jgi:hypothetical protein